MTSSGDQHATPPGEPEPPSEPIAHRKAFRKLRRVVESFLIDYIAVALILLLATVVSERALETHQPELIKFQTHLRQAVEHLNPLNLARYLFRDFGSPLWEPIGTFFDDVEIAVSRISTWAEYTLKIPHILILLLVFPFALITGIVKLALLFGFWFLILVSSPVLLPIIVISKGSALEAVLVIVISVPLSVFFGRMILFADRSVELWVRLYLWFLVSFWTLAITSLFYLLVQGAMLGSLWAVGRLSPAAPTGAAASAYVSFAIRCAGKTAEHSLTARVVDTVKRRLFRAN